MFITHCGNVFSLHERMMRQHILML